ncbi:MAG: PHP domain-containing protein [Ruminococcaceae bacterium]|nr:PHP domain-containing protein [Oscillospiraceae bacterium]
MASKLDLHIHTTASDGSDTPALLAEKLAASGIRLFSVTDHDTIDGALEMEGLVPKGACFLRGVEFSCVSPAGKCHILGYGYDPACPEFLAALEEGRSLRREKLARRLEHLQEKFDITLTDRELQWLNSLKSPGKPHLGKLLVDRGMAPDLTAAIQTFLKGVPGRDRIEAETAVRAIAAAGGLPVWAHPLGGEGEKRLSKEKFAAQLETLLGFGIRGLECWYSRYSMEDVHFLLEQAKKHGLIVTGGSDYHGANKPDLELGMLNAEGVAWTVDSDWEYGIICK